jgi:hypothetical protein
MEGNEGVADEEPVIQDCTVSQLSGRPRLFLLAEKEYVQTAAWWGGGGGVKSLVLNGLFAKLIVFRQL